MTHPISTQPITTPMSITGFLASTQTWNGGTTRLTMKTKVTFKNNILLTFLGKTDIGNIK